MAISNEEIYDFWLCAKKINPKCTLAQAAALVRRLLREKRAAKRLAS